MVYGFYDSVEFVISPINAAFHRAGRWLVLVRLFHCLDMFDSNLIPGGVCVCWTIGTCSWLSTLIKINRVNIIFARLIVLLSLSMANKWRTGDV